MSRFFLALIVLLPGIVQAAPTFSVDPASPAATLPPSPSDILMAGPVVGISEAALGLGPGFADNLNALSFGGDFVEGPVLSSLVEFSVDRLSLGLPGTAVESEAVTSEAAGDVFSSVPTASPAILGTNTLVDDEGSLGLTPGFFGDDLDALNLVDSAGGTPFFSFDFLSAANGFGAGTAANDIFFGSTATMFASGESFGLAGTDDIDALILRDRGTIGVLDPGLDTAYFSLSSFSPTTFTGSGGVYTPVAHGTPIVGGGVSPADILFTDFLGPITLAASAPSIGLFEFDELNALSNPEPGSLALMACGLGGFAVYRRRRSKRSAE